MAPAQVTEDYYMILKVEQDATTEQIVRSYKQLALKIHPDRNAKLDATQEFQALGRAYETLKDASERRCYDLIYPSIVLKQSRFTTQSTPVPGASPSTSRSTETPDETAQIGVLQKSAQEREARWRKKKTSFDCSIMDIKGQIQELEQKIRKLYKISTDEAAEESKKNSWGTWLMSGIYKTAPETEEERERKDRERQERRIEKDLKERRLQSKEVELKKEQTLFNEALELKLAADKIDDKKIQDIQGKIRERERRELLERTRVAREKEAKTRKEQQEQWEKEQRARRMQKEKEDREAAERLRKVLAEQRAARQKEFEDQAKRRQNLPQNRDHSFMPNRNMNGTSNTSCEHHGWWPKVVIRMACPQCQDVWTYLLECPGCKMKACPKCQHDIRPKGRPRYGRVRREEPQYEEYSHGYSWYDD